MNQEDRKNWNELLKRLDAFLSDKYHPDNGWKTKRAVFESETVSSLKSINEHLKNLNSKTEPIPRLVNDVDDLKGWRKRQTKILVWILATIATPILATAGYLIANKFL